MIKATCFQHFFTFYETDVLKFKIDLVGWACVPVMSDTLKLLFLPMPVFKFCDLLKTVNFNTLKWDEWHREAAVLFWSQGLQGFVLVLPTCYGTIMYYRIFID